MDHEVNPIPILILVVLCCIIIVIPISIFTTVQLTYYLKQNIDLKSTDNYVIITLRNNKLKVN